MVARLLSDGSVPKTRDPDLPVPGSASARHAPEVGAQVLDPRSASEEQKKSITSPTPSSPINITFTTVVVMSQGGLIVKSIMRSMVDREIYCGIDIDIDTEIDHKIDCLVDSEIDSEIDCEVDRMGAIVRSNVRSIVVPIVRSIVRSIW